MYSIIIMALKLYSKTGAARLEFSPSSSDKQSERIMGEASISLSFSLPSAIEILMGDYVDYEGRKYVALANYTPTKKSTREYQYSLSLYTIESTLASVKVLKPASEHQELNFSYDARPHEHIQLIVDNANRAGLGSWRVGTVLSAGSVNIEYNNKYCLEALNDIAEAYNSEWWIENGVINLIKREHGSPIRLAYQEGLTSLYASAARGKPITRLYPLGSTRNIDTSKYGSSRLHLPRNARYIERNTHLGLIEASEEASFSHIYPRYTGVVRSVRTEDRRSSEGKPYKVYYIKDNDIPFNANLYELQGLTKHIVFQSGELNGRDFEANYLTNTKEWEIITQFPYEGTQLPREPLIPKAGDKYIPYNFRMPEEYISRAEEELLTEANKYLDKVSIDNTIYKASTDYTYLLEQGINLGLGQRISLHDVDLFPSTAGEHQTRIIAISRSLLIPQQMEIECSATIERGRIEQMESGLDKMRAAYHRVEATMPSILRSNDSTDPSEDNVLSAIRSIKAIQRTALRKDTHDRTSYSLGSTEHVPGIVGWLLSPEGDLDLRNLKVSGTLEVDELRKNRISIQEGEHYFSSGNAIVEEVLEGDKMRVKGEQGEVSSLIAGDYVIGKWTNTSGSIEVCKIKITAVNGLLLSYTLAPNTSIRPRVGMHLAQMGHDTDTRRQRASVVRANAIIQYAGVQGWEILPQHITAVMGDLEGFSFEPFGALVGSGVYINNAYITGTITQKSADGRSTRPLPFYKGEWTATSIAHTGDQYLYAGHKWTYQGVTPTTTAPSATANWFDDGEVAESLISNLSIGGRNYIRNSSQEFKMKGLHKNFNLSDKLKEGSEVTISAYIVIHAQPKVNDDKARLKFVLTPATWITDNWGLADLPTGVSEGIVQKTITLTRDVTRLSVYPNYYYLKEDKGAEVTVKWIKLEYGNKATDYTEAPEDVADALKKVEDDSKKLAISEAGKAQVNAIAEASRRDTALKTELEGKVSSILSSVASIQGDLQRQIDRQVEMFWGEQPPTGRIGWTEADDAKHEGDTYTVRSPEGVTITPQNAKQYPNVGKSWRWHGNGWIEIADTDVTRALALAGEAKASADGKVTHFRGSAIPTGYKQGDLWTLTGVWNGFKQGSILTAIQDEVTGQYNPTHWKEEVRYTDDTAIRTLSIGGRNLILKSQGFKVNDFFFPTMKLSEDWIDGQEYTLSMRLGLKSKVYNITDARQLDLNGKPVGIALHGQHSGVRFATIFPAWEETPDINGLYWATLVHSFTMSPRYHTNPDNHTLMIHLGAYFDKTYSGEVKWIKLEKGNKATDYTEAPEDTADAIRRAETESKNLAVSEAGKAQANAIATAQADSTAKANQALNDAKAYADSKINEARASIQQVSNALNIAKSELQTAQRTATEAKTRAENTYTRAMADGKINEAERRAIAQAESKANDALAEASRRDTALKGELEGKVSALVASVTTIQGDLQRQIDKQVEMFWGEKPPTGRIGWTEADDVKHEGDTYTVRSPEGVTITPQNAKQYPNVGKSWRWHGNGWLEIADTDVTRALALAGEAKASADGKVTHFRGSAIPTGYKQGDLWTLTATWNGFKQGSILTAIKDEVIGQYNPTHWKEEVRYTDDTALHNLSIGGRNLVRRFDAVKQDGYCLGCWLFPKPEQWQAGLEYTLSFNLGTTHNDPLVWLYVDKYSRGIARIYPQSEPKRKDDGLFYGRYTLTFRPTQEDIDRGRPRDGWDGFRLYLGHSSNGRNANDPKAKVDRVKLEKGNKATDYTPAPEEIDANILSAEERAKQYALEGDRTLKTLLEDKMSVNDYLRQAIAKGTKQEAGKIDTGLVLTEVLGVKDRDGLVRSFLSGDTAYPAFAAGVDNFGENNQSSRVMITHDGDVILGQMRMLGDAGVISFVPMAGGTPYLNIGGTPKAINDMVSGQFSGTDRQSEKVVKSYYGEDEIDEIVLIDNFRINKSGTSIRISGSMTVDAQSSRIVDMHNLEVGGLPDRQNSTVKRNGEGYTNIAASIILYYRASETGQYNQVRSWYRTAYSYWDGSYYMGYEEYKSGEQRLDIAESIPGMQQGYYKLALAIKHNGSDEARSNSDVTAQMAMTTESGEREIHLSSQALYAIFGSRRFFHVDENAVTIKHRLDIFGDTNMPGILAAGKVTKWGTIDNAYGAKVNETGKVLARVERQGDNSYKVYHRIGHSNYTVQITPFDTRDAGSILEVAPTYFRCCFYGTVDSRRYQHEFCYTCIGNNQ